MNGMVNSAIEDLVTTHHGADVWSHLLDTAASPVRSFGRMQQYPDSLTYDLVAAAVAVLDTPADALLRVFGRHWIIYAASNGFGAMLGGRGTDFSAFLRDLDAMHARISLAMPEVSPPAFRCFDIAPGQIELHYHSHRPGLAPFVLGLLEGLGERFGVAVTSSLHTAREPGETRDIFDVRWS